MNLNGNSKFTSENPGWFSTVYVGVFKHHFQILWFLPSTPKYHTWESFFLPSTVLGRELILKPPKALPSTPKYKIFLAHLLPSISQVLYLGVI